MKRVAVFASGAGSNALSLLKAATELRQVQIPLLIVDQASSPLLKKMGVEFPNVKSVLISPPNLKNANERRVAHETEMLKALKEHSIDWCFLAGYMRIVGTTLLQAFKEPSGVSRIINIHPSLLPKYPGLHAYERAFEARDQVAGVTIHFVDQGVDTGPVVLQKNFKREDQDTLQNFIERGKALEWEMYAQVLKELDQTGTIMKASANP